jgi:ABC-type polysaccharide/polyol phosphate export permease
VSSLTVHFRDLRDLLGNVLTLTFFATPIVYPLSQAPEWSRRFLALNPFTHLAVSYQAVLFDEAPFSDWRRVVLLAGIGLAAFVIGYFVFDRLRDTLAEEV